METNDIKNIWKSGVDKDIESYSDEELSKMAGKSIRRIYPSVILILLIITVIIFLIVNITIRHTTTGMRMLDLFVLLILTVTSTLSTFSFLAMKKYKADMPVKKWLEYSIKEVEKKLNFNVRYNLPICAIALFFALGYYYIFIWLNNFPVNFWLTGTTTAGVVIGIIFGQKFAIRNQRKILRELKELYKQFEFE